MPKELPGGESESTAVQGALGPGERKTIDHREPWFMQFREMTSMAVCVTYRCNHSCRYCYARALADRFPRDMTEDEFRFAVKWARKQGKEVMRFLGGEALIHPEIFKFLKIAYNSGLQSLIYTNGGYQKKVLDFLDPYYVQMVWTNFSAYETHTRKGKKTFRHNVEKMSAKGVRFLFAYVVHDEASDFEEMIDLAKNNGAHHVRISLTTPGSAGEIQPSQVSERLKPLAEKLIEIFSRCNDTGVPAYMYRPIPACAFSPEQKKRLEAVSKEPYFTRCPLGAEGSYGHMMIVNPDLSTFPCSSVFIQGPSLREMENVEQVSAFFKPLVEELARKPLREACVKCKPFKKYLDLLDRNNDVPIEEFYDKSLCQAACLNYRLWT